MKGKILVFEGIDGSGKNTQANLIKGFLATMDIRSEVIHFPLYEETFFGKEIATYLNGGYGGLETINPKLAALLYAGDRYEKKSYIVDALDKGTILILDRYVPSNIAHHAAKLPESHWIDFKNWIEHVEYKIFGLPYPDVVFFLNVPNSFSDNLVMAKERRSYTSLKKDLHEENSGYMASVHEVFKWLSKEEQWFEIECSQGDLLRSVKDIHEELRGKVLSFLSSTQI